MSIFNKKQTNKIEVNKIYTLIFLIGSLNLGFSQSTFSGIVTSENIPLNNVEIINLTQKKAIKTNENGEFQIQVAVNDIITFYLKDYTQFNEKIKKEHLNIYNKIVLVKRPIELGEITIAKAPKIVLKNDYESLKIAKIEKEQLNAKVVGVYTGEIPNGVDFIAVGNKIVNLIGKIFKKDEIAREKVSKVSFKQYVEVNFEHHYLLEKLVLKENEYELFLTFCEEDKQAVTIVKKNKLEILDFLMQRRKAFKPE